MIAWTDRLNTVDCVSNLHTLLGVHEGDRTQSRVQDPQAAFQSAVRQHSFHLLV